MADNAKKLDIKIIPVTEVVSAANASINSPISMEEPISLFADSAVESEPEVAAVVVPVVTPPVPTHEPSVSVPLTSNEIVLESAPAEPVITVAPVTSTVLPIIQPAFEAPKVEIAAAAPASVPTPAPESKKKKLLSDASRVNIAAPSAPAEISMSHVVAESPAPASVQEEIVRDIPYLFENKVEKKENQNENFRLAAQILPASGTILSNDVEILKQYLMMREQDVSVLSAQLAYVKEKLSQTEDVVRRFKQAEEDKNHEIATMQDQVNKLKSERSHEVGRMGNEVDNLKQDIKLKIDRIRLLESEKSESESRYTKLKERVRMDIRKIRTREKELDNRLEILKRDSETLISSRENKILELKRKIDLLEFNFDALEDQNENEKNKVKKLNENMEQILKVLKLAVGIVENSWEQPSVDSKKEAS